MLVILKEPLVINKCNKVRFNVHSTSCWFSYTPQLVSAQLLRPQFADVLQTDQVDRFFNKVSTVGTYTVQAKTLITKQYCRQLQWLYS
jgi:hypothetical protein